MPKRYAPAQRQEALRLLAFQHDSVPIVHQLTDIPRSTLYHWRNQEFSNKTDSIGQENIPYPIGGVQQTDPPEPPPSPDPPPPNEPSAGVPGRTYPYPPEDDESDAEQNLEDFRRVRDILMNHAQQLAENLKPDDPDINRRSLALSRILDRIHQLDDMLPSLIPEQVMRWEFVYDGMVHDRPPWERTE